MAQYPEGFAPTERTAKRAAELWKRMLRSPRFDNGDRSEAGLIGEAMAISATTEVPEDVLEAFAQKLVERLLTPDEGGFIQNGLHTDYGPERFLVEIAMEVGLRVQQFPIKTSMHVYSEYLTLRYGYSAEHMFHYALDDGRWLVTSLSGSEIEKIKRFVTKGEPLEFTVEEDVQPATSVKR